MTTLTTTAQALDYLEAEWMEGCSELPLKEMSFSPLTVLSRHQGLELQMGEVSICDSGTP